MSEMRNSGYVLQFNLPRNGCFEAEHFGTSNIPKNTSNLRPRLRRQCAHCCSFLKHRKA